MGLLFVTMFSLGWRLAADFVVWGVCRLFLSWVVMLPCSCLDGLLLVSVVLLNFAFSVLWFWLCCVGFLLWSVVCCG